jgi:DNA-binding IclR family transcriptional regulator
MSNAKGTRSSARLKQGGGALKQAHLESVGRALRLLEAFADSPRPMSLSQLAAAAQIDKSGAQRLANTLVALGYLERSDNGLRPGKRILDRAYDYLRTNPLIGRSYAVLAELRRESEERVALSLHDDLTMVYAVRMEDLTMVYAVRMESKQDAFLAHLPGRRIPTFCTSSGRAVLAVLPEEQAVDIVARSERRPITPKTTIDEAAALAQVKRTRRLGFAVAVEEVLIGEVAVAAAVLDVSGAPLGAVSLAGSLGEWTRDKFANRFGPMVVAAARAISDA